MDKNAFLINFSESNRCDFGRVEFANQPDDQRIFSAIWALESAVNNGGFSLYFVSSAGGTANFASTALRRIGADTCAAIVDAALAVVSSKPLPVAQDARKLLVAQLSVTGREQLENLDVLFFSYPDNLTDLLFAFVLSRPTSFGPIPQ